MELIYTCHVCHERLSDDGFIEVSYQDMTTYHEQQLAWKTSHSGVGMTLRELLDQPDPAEWVAVHHACNFLGDRGTYTIDITRVATTEHLLQWTLHFAGKDFLESTNWVEFVQGLVGDFNV